MVSLLIIFQEDNFYELRWFFFCVCVCSCLKTYLIYIYRDGSTREGSNSLIIHVMRPSLLREESYPWKRPELHTSLTPLVLCVVCGEYHPFVFFFFFIPFGIWYSNGCYTSSRTLFHFLLFLVILFVQWRAYELTYVWMYGLYISTIYKTHHATEEYAIKCVFIWYGK